MSSEIKIYVAPTGNDQWSGNLPNPSGDRTDGPFLTVERARNAIRTLKKEKGGLSSNVRVYLRSGIYYLTKSLSFDNQDSADADKSITYCSYDNERAVISGGVVVSDWREDKINNVPCWVANFKAEQTFTQLFVNSERRYQCSSPKAPRDFHFMAGVPAAELKRDTGKMFFGCMQCLVNSADLPAKIANIEELQFVVLDHWYENHLWVESYDPQKRQINFLTQGRSRFSRDETGRPTRYKAIGAKELCTDPGEWYYSASEELLYYIPYAHEVLSSVEVIVPQLKYLLQVKGENPEHQVINLHFEKLDFRHADWSYPKENAGAIQASWLVPGAVTFQNAANCSLYSCSVSRIAQYAVEMRHGSYNNQVIACDFYDLGAGGVKILHECGMPDTPPSPHNFNGLDFQELGWPPTLREHGKLPGRDKVPGTHITVSDSIIREGGRIFHSAIGIWIGNAGRNRILHNDIHDFYYSAISVGWIWGYAPNYCFDNLILNNTIHHIGAGMLSDMGGIYTLGRSPGTALIGNRITDVESYGYGGWGIYPDEGSSQLIIRDNCVLRTKCGGFHQHYGRDNLVENNIFCAGLTAQVTSTRIEPVMPYYFRHNLVQPARIGPTLNGNGLLTAIRFDYNCYIVPGAPLMQPDSVRFGKNHWEQWQRLGHDQNSRLIDPKFLDADSGYFSANEFEDADKLGIDIAKIAVTAGPRLKYGTLPVNIQDWNSQYPLTEQPKAIVDMRLEPHPAEWPTQTESVNYELKAYRQRCFVEPGTEQTLSVTLENLGNAATDLDFSLEVVPASAATLSETKFSHNLRPGERHAINITAKLGNTLPDHFEIRLHPDNFPTDAGVVAPGSLLPSAWTFHARKVVQSPKVEKISMPGGIPEALRGNAILNIRDGSASIAEARVGVIADMLALDIRVIDKTAVYDRNPLACSGIEIYAVVKTGDAPSLVVLNPPADGQSERVYVITKGKPQPAKTITAVVDTVSDGYKMRASIPLRLLGLTTKTKVFFIDIAVNANHQSKGKNRMLRGFAACEVDPTQDSDGFVKVVVE